MSTDRTYSQAEADALIAGAYLVAAERLQRLAEKWRRDWPYKGDVPTDPVYADIARVTDFADQLEDEIESILSSLPDAARLALEEREQAAEEAAAKEFFRKFVDYFEADIDSRPAIDFKNFRGALARHEAKLIADTRLDEAEWWADGHHEGSHRWPACPMCARIAAYRAAVQPGG